MHPCRRRKRACAFDQPRIAQGPCRAGGCAVRGHTHTSATGVHSDAETCGALLPHARTRTHARARTHTHTHAHARTHTHTRTQVMAHSMSKAKTEDECYAMVAKLLVALFGMPVSLFRVHLCESLEILQTSECERGRGR